MENELHEPSDGPLPVMSIVVEDLRLAEAIAKFIKLDKQKAEVKKFFDEYEQSIRDIKERVKIGFHFQDEEGIVYQVDEMQWKNVRVTPYEIKRTRREGERQGTLSMVKAKELGYELE
jgi:hypothetical protein